MLPDDIRPNNVQPRLHRTWWRAPLVASLVGLPFLVLEYRWFRSEDGIGAFGGAFYWSVGLLALSWVLPHRRSLRTPRVLAAGAGLGCVLLPMLFALALGAALSGI
ncbi:hypothetical protein [Streptomyces filipinensis]|uniref:hypothetical protein n=1 Tax=Streptomyces filipinensis TaxID=66887 RepID=UPI00177EA62A|nr:hypothetical protein [Streptomyces filipinensis]